MKAIAFHVEGRVQGVGFRNFTRACATRIGVQGWVRNTWDGHVEGEAEGPPAELATFEREIRVGPPYARVDALRIQPIAPRGSVGFEVRATTHEA